MNTDIYIFSALSDPTRRLLLDRLRQGPASVTELLSVVDVSQPAVSQHLQILKAASLVTVTKQRNRRIYQLDPRGFALLRSYIDGFWDVALHSYQLEAQRLNLQENTDETNPHP